MANTIKFKRASGSDPSASDLAIGEPGLRTDTAELFFKKDDGTVAKVSGGGGGPNFKYLELRNAANNGAASFPGNDFTLVTAGTTTAISPSAANTLLVSVSGVIQKPNAGTSTSGITGFIIDGSRFKTATNLPAAPDFIVFQESGGIGEPSDNTVTSAKIVDGAIVNADINASAAIAGSKISPIFSANVVSNGGTNNQVILESSNGCIEISRAAGGAFIDFKNVASDDFDARIQENNGGFDITGNVNIAAGLDVTGAITLTDDFTLSNSTFGNVNLTGKAFTGQRDNATTFGFGFNSVHQRGTISSPSVSNSGDSIFTLVGQLYDSGAYRDSCRIHYEVDGTPSSGSAPGRIVFKTTPSSSTTSAERMRIDSDGAVNINTTTNPTSNSTGFVQMVVDNGRDGINLKHNHSGNCVNLWRANGDGGLVHFYRSDTSHQGNAVGSITVNSSSTSYNEQSDYRLKENVTAISDGITRLKTLKPSRFNFKVDKDTTVDGFLAHEVTLAVPEAITGTKDEVDSDNNPIYQQIDKSKLVPLLVAALQEAIGRIEALEAK